MYDLSLFIFRRDYRLQDNTALSQALSRSKNVLCVFILTPEQILHNDYFSPRAAKFMMESLGELSYDISKNSHGRLHLFAGDNIKVIEDIYSNIHFDAIFFNVDYTPYSRDRDKKISKWCLSKKIGCHTYEDYLLVNLSNKLLTLEGGPYKKFTPYYNTACKEKIKAIKPIASSTIKKFIKLNSMKDNLLSRSLIINKYGTLELDFNQAKSDLTELNKYMNKLNNLPNNEISGGRLHALSTLNDASMRKYDHNNLATNTSMLSPYIKFGCISIREVYHKNARKKDFIRQLHWRDFYMRIVWYFPRVLAGPNRNFKENFNEIRWENKQEHIRAWTEGNTKIGIVDAAMRQLIQTGYMHNRARLIVGSFLIKNLFVDWQIGEKYFANMLVDYDPSVNNGNWQWLSGGGVDSQPYFRVFNPLLQALKFDPKCVYLKTWLNRRCTCEHDCSHSIPIVNIDSYKQNIIKIKNML